jgi:hypothetical protein
MTQPYYPTAAPYLRAQLATEAYLSTAVRSIPQQREAKAKAMAYLHSLTILLNSPEGASSDYGVANEAALPSGAIQAARQLIGEARWAATGWEEPTSEPGESMPAVTVEEANAEVAASVQDRVAADLAASVDPVPDEFAGEPVEDPAQLGKPVSEGLAGHDQQTGETLKTITNPQDTTEYARAVAKASGKSKG